MSLPTIDAGIPPTGCVEMMNPQRVMMLAEAAREQASSPPPGIKLEDTQPEFHHPPASGANCAPVGDAALRASRDSREMRASPTCRGHRETLPAISSIEQSTVFPRGAKTVVVDGIKITTFDPSASSASSKKRPLGEDDKERKSKVQKIVHYKDVLSLGPAPRPNKDTEYLMSLLRNRPLTLRMLPPSKKKGMPGPAKAYELLISNAGLVQNEALSKLGFARTLPLFLHPDTPKADGAISCSVKGQLLEDVWSGLNNNLKYQFARQLRNLVKKMRAHDKQPQGSVGSVQSGPYSLLLDKHADHTYYAIRRRPSQKEFMALLMSTLHDSVPDNVAKALVSRFQVDYPTVFTHAALCPRNIVVYNDTIGWILGWDCAGHYPAWWEYARFFEARTAEANHDWYDYAAEIFDEEYPAELAAYQGLVRCQQP